MHGLVYHGPGRHSWEELEHPAVQGTQDALVWVDATTICGTDLHILRGDVPEVPAGTVLGHEAVGIVTETGVGVRGFSVGDRVLVSCISPCGTCEYCRAAAYGQCRGGGGWLLGHRINGTQAGIVRVPYADFSLHHIPDLVSDEAALMLADIVPTAYEVGALNGDVRPGDSVAIIGAGPIGLAAIMTARLLSPSQVIVVDPVAARRDAAKRLGADLVLDSAEDVLSHVNVATDGQGADVVMEAVGRPEAFELAAKLVRPGGHLANIGVHGDPAALHLETLWSRNITVTTGLVDTRTTPRLMRMLANRQFDPTAFVTHRFGLDEIMEAYDVFADAASSEALKVVLFAERSR